MAFEKASCNETLLLRTASQELHVDTAVGYTQRGGPRCWRKRYLVHFVDQGVVNDQLLITQTRTRAERSQIHPSPFPATKTAPPPMHQPKAKTSAAQRFLTFLTKMVIKVSKTITIVTVLGKRPQYPVLMNEKYKSGFGEAVRMQRAVCNLTKERLSLMVGINRLTLRRIESGDANPTLDVMYRISEGLGVPLSELIAQAEEAEKRDGASSKTD